MAKIAISIPDEVYQAVEKVRMATGESRSHFFRRAVEERLRRAREQDDVARYISGYQKYPETEEEAAMAMAALHHPLNDDSWEEEYRRWSEANPPGPT